MKAPPAITSCIVILCLLATRPGFAFDRGGVSVDFLAADKKRQAAASKQVLFHENVEVTDPKTGLPPGWRRGFNLFSIHPEEKEQLKELIAPLVSQKISTEDGKRFLTLTTDAKAQAIRAEHTGETSKFKPDFCGSIQHWVALPEPYQERKLRIRFRYRGVVAEGVKGANHLLIQGIATDRKESPSSGKQVDYKQAWFSRMNGHWQRGEMILLCSGQAKSVSFYLKNYGCSTVDIDDFIVEEIEQEDSGLSVYLTPQFFADNLYCMAEGEPSILKFTQLNEAKSEIKKPVIVLELPQEIEVIDSRAPLAFVSKKQVVLAGKTRVQYRYALGGLKKYIKRDELNHYTASYFLLSSSLPTGETTYAASYWIEDGDYRSKRKNFSFKIIKPEHSAAPVGFMSGAVVNRGFDIQSSKNRQTLVDFYANKGFNTIHIGSAPGELMTLFGKKGIKRYTQPYWLVNGYRIGKGEKPDEVRFQFIDGSYHERGICPVAVYRPGKYFSEQVEAPLRKLLVEDRMADGIMPNWEPYMFKFKGCFCSRCKAEFIKYSKLPEAQIDKEWPKEIITTHRALWIKFRAWQHGRLMETLEATIQRVGKEAGIESHFVPEIATLSLTEDGRSHFEQVAPLDYIKKLKIIEPWGPYVGNFKYPGRYVYQTGAHLIMEAKTREAVGYIGRHIPVKKQRPQLIGFPHASQGNFGMAEPEGIAFDTLCLFVNGWQGALAYHFPDGFDARYWNALATANRSISLFENQVMKGRVQTRHDLKAISPLPELDPSSGGGHYQVDSESALIFSREFVYKEQRLLVIGNAWKYGDAFVHLAINDVPPGKTFVLREPLTGRCYANKEGQVGLSPDELNQGMLLHVGALRFGFFLLEPYHADREYGQVIIPSQMDSMRETFLPEILKAITFEANYQSADAE